MWLNQADARITQMHIARAAAALIGWLMIVT
jgi:hypothetical protein